MGGSVGSGIQSFKNITRNPSRYVRLTQNPTGIRVYLRKNGRVGCVGRVFAHPYGLSLFSLISRSLDPPVPLFFRFTQLRLHLPPSLDSQSRFSDSLSHASLFQTPSVLSQVTPPSPLASLCHSAPLPLPLPLPLSLILRRSHSASFCTAPAHSSSTGAPITRPTSLSISAIDVRKRTCFR